jgi:hypothetical protein
LNTDGLGTGRIAQLLRNDLLWNRDEEKIGKALEEELITQSGDSTKAFSRNDFERLGMTCAPSPSQECNYSGGLKFRLNASGSPHRDKETIVSIRIVSTSFAKPGHLRVMKSEVQGATDTR